jgi:hypothetical protein
MPRDSNPTVNANGSTARIAMAHEVGNFDTPPVWWENVLNWED